MMHDHKGGGLCRQHACQNGTENSMYGVTKSGWMEEYLFESWIDRFVIHVKDYEEPVLLLCDGHSTHLTYSTV